MINFLGAGGKVFALHRVIEVVRSTPSISFVGFKDIHAHMNIIVYDVSYIHALYI